jgi:hypothetical protein
MTTLTQEASSAEVRETGIEPGRYILTRSFVLRLTGFPIELMESFAAPELALATDQCWAAHQDAVAKCEALLSSSHDMSRGTRRKLKRFLEMDGDPEALTFDAEDLFGEMHAEPLHQEVEQLQRAFTTEAELLRRALELYKQELERTRAALYQFAVSRRFQEVLQLSSPGLARFTPSDPHPPPVRNSHVRQRELSWISYLQRLTTKNETISFFGPCAWGEFDAQEPAAASIRLSEQTISERTVYVERWVCESLARLMSADPEVMPLLKLRLAEDLVIQEQDATLLASKKTIAISPEQKEYLERCATSVQRSHGQPLAEELVAQGLLLRDVRVPATALPYGVLQKEVESWPLHPARIRWQKDLNEIEKCREAIERAADFESRGKGIEAITEALTNLGSNSNRESQSLYASRLPINEDCRLGVERMVLGKPAMEQLADDAAPWYDLWRDMAGLYATRMHQWIQESWRSMGAKPVPLPVFWPVFMKAWSRLPSLESEIQQAWDRQLGSRCVEPVVSLTAEDLGFLRNNFSLRRMKAFDNLAPDLQIVAPDVQALSEGRWSLLLAEIHPDFTPWQHCFFVWCPDPQAFAGDYAHQGGQGTAAVVGGYPPYFTSAHTALGIYPFAHQWKFVGAAGPEGVETLRTAETMVEVTEDDVLLRHTSGRALGSILHTWTIALNTHRLELRGSSNHSPRLQVGRVIVQREAWNVEPGALLRESVQAGGYKGHAALREFRRKNGLPETVFIRGCLTERLTLDKDIKPVFADFRSPLLMEMVGKMISRFEKLSITEMLPGIQDCWLEGSEGHYSSEFRTVVLAAGDSRQERA